MATALLSHAAIALPLGDGKVSSTPKVGYVYSCQTQFNGGGAVDNVPWITGNTWQPENKLAISGNVSWPNNSTNIKTANNQRVISANNLPNHATGVYPVAVTDPAYQYDSNPNSIRTQTVALTLTSNPKIASKASCLPMGAIGFAVSGAVIFNALDAGGRDAVAHEVQDKCGGHPEKSGAYHYHGNSKCFKDTASTQAKHSDLIGYALDGFGIYGLKTEGGKAVSNKNLDACHGHSHSLNWNGKAAVLYHYHLTPEYPYSLGCFKGTPVKLTRSR
jgi:hypothetical protein